MPERNSRRLALRAGARAGGSAVLSRTLAGALVAFGARSAQAATIVAVRVWPARDYTRMALEFDEPLNATQLQLDDPPRLVVDLQGVEIDAALRELIAKIRPDDPYIRQVRIGQNQPHVARIVLDLKSAVDPQLFTLAPAGNYRHRLVLDLYPTVPVDPLRALLDEMNGPPGHRSSPRASQTPPAPNPSLPPVVPAVPGDDPIAALLHGQQPVSPEPAQQAHAGSPPFSSKRRLAPAEHPRPTARLVTIAIDPGHGGEDPGAIGSRGSHEKDIVLSIAKRLHARIKTEPGLRPWLTRDGDYFVPLATRVEKARRVQADLFVSIHADAFVRPSARGASVYVLSERGASSSAAGWLARKENASDLIGGVNLKQRNHELQQVLLDLSTTAQIRQSSQLGASVLTELGGVGNLHKPRIEQAAFAVLKAPDIPSILVETAFISNPEEERRLGDPHYQAKVADAIFRGILAWVRRNPPAARGRPT